MGRGPKLLVTGFGPFPGAPANPTEALVRGLAHVPPETFGAAGFCAVVLPTEYRRSWSILRPLYGRLAPDVVVHFGLSTRADAIMIERTARRRCASDRPDAVGFAPRRGLARRTGPETLASTLAIESIVAALVQAGFPAAASDDAGDYVCNATLYRSLAETAAAPRRIGFVHVPPEGAGGLTREGLAAAAGIVLQAACAAWGANARHHTWTKTDSPSTVTGQVRARELGHVGQYTATLRIAPQVSLIKPCFSSGPPGCARHAVAIHVEADYAPQTITDILAATDSDDTSEITQPVFVASHIRKRHDAVLRRALTLLRGVAAEIGSGEPAAAAG